MKEPSPSTQYTLHLLVVRFSALGDVAMTVPIVKALALSRPDVHISVASRPFAKAFYENLAPNIDFVSIDLKEERYKGLRGLENLYKDLLELDPDVVADLHDVLRTKYLRMRFMLAGIPVSVIKKNRRQRKKLVNGGGGKMESVFVRYSSVFENIGFTIPGLFNNTQRYRVMEIKTHTPECSQKLLTTVKTRGGIGIAPFAAHKGKIYPIEHMERVIAILRHDVPQYPIILFGGRGKEEEIITSWCDKYENLFFASRECHGLRDEMYIMQYLLCMVSMDSANMHLASLVGTPVVSIWGATHTAAGFLGWQQSTDDVVDIPMTCRPCSIYGNKECKRKDYACLYNIKPEAIVERIKQHLYT